MLSLRGEPVLARSVRALAASGCVTGIVVAAPETKQEAYEALLAGLSLEIPWHVVSGGPTRRDSVANGLMAVPADTTFVAVHDAARPLLRPEWLCAALTTAVERALEGAIVAIAVHDTVKRVDETGLIVDTLDRRPLWRAQTPQVFRLETLLRAHQAVPLEMPVTDEAQLVSLAGLGPIAVVPGGADNLKITTAEDAAVAEALLFLRQG